MKIETSTPVSGIWQAIDSDSYDGAEDAGRQCVGHGATEREAINDLVDQIDEAAYERGWRDGLAHARKAGDALARSVCEATNMGDGSYRP